MTRDEQDRLDEVRDAVVYLVARFDAVLPTLATREFVAEALKSHASDCVTGQMPAIRATIPASTRAILTVLGAIAAGVGAVITALIGGGP